MRSDTIVNGRFPRDPTALLPVNAFNVEWFSEPALSSQPSLFAGVRPH